MNRSTLSFDQLLKPSHRTLPEQIAGFGIIALSSFLFALAEAAFFQTGEQWYNSLHHASWTLPSAWNIPMLAFVHGSLVFSFWTLWRLSSLRLLKLELSLFLSMFILETAWALSLFKGRETLLALIALLLWLSVAVLLSALFWRKEKIAGSFFFLPLVWIFYLISTNMVLCIANP